MAVPLRGDLKGPDNVDKLLILEKAFLSAIIERAAGKARLVTMKSNVADHGFADQNFERIFNEMVGKPKNTVLMVSSKTLQKIADLKKSDASNQAVQTQIATSIFGNTINGGSNDGLLNSARGDNTLAINDIIEMLGQLGEPKFILPAGQQMPVFNEHAISEVLRSA
jgi:hypothetical protein